MNYYENCEEIGNQLFLKWAKEVKCFTELTRQDLYSRVDWIGKTIKGNPVNCELKVRLAGEDVFENLEIEKMFLINDHGKTEVTTFDVNEKEKVMLEVYFKEIDRAALEVSCYVKK